MSGTVRSMQMTKKLIFNLILLGVVIIVFFLLFEIFVRIFLPVSDTMWTGDPVIGHIHIPNKEGYYISSEYKTQFKFNSEGFRDVNHQLYDDRYRIAFMGDSFVDALEVNFNQTFHQRFKGMLNSSYEILNFGLYQFSTAQEYLEYNEYIKKYHPQLVYLFVFSNDPYESCLADEKNPSFYFENGQVKERSFTPNNYSSFEIFVSKYIKSAVFLRTRLTPTPPKT